MHLTVVYFFVLATPICGGFNRLCFEGLCRAEFHFRFDTECYFLIGVFDIFILFLQYISNSIQVMQWCRDLDHLNCCPLPLPKVINSWPASIHLHSTLLTLAHLLATSDKLKGATGQGFKCARVKVCQEWVKESIQMLQGNGLANLSEAIWWKMS